jgi:hypothetical protein
VRLTVVVSIVSVIAVVAARVDRQRSKLPPRGAADRGRHAAGVDVHVVARRGTLDVPRLAPAAIVIVAPLLSVTVTALCAALVSDAV